MSKKIRQIIRRLAGQKASRGMFYPIQFSDYGDAITMFATCPVCGVITQYKITREHMTRSWHLGVNFDVSCPSCPTVVTAYMSGHPGGRHGECQWVIVEAGWNGNTRTDGLASQPPTRLASDTPAE